VIEGGGIREGTESQLDLVVREIRRSLSMGRYRLRLSVYRHFC